MSDLNDLFKQLAEEKAKDPKFQQQAKIKESVKGDLGSLFSALAEEKAKDPKAIAAKKLEKEIKEHVKTDLGSLFAELAALNKQKDTLIEEHPELIEEVVEDTTEFTPELVEEVITEVAPLPTPIGNVPAEVQIPDIDKYLKAPKQPQQEEPTPYSKEFKNVNDKIKFLEQWIGKIQNAGPGSGEVNFRYLDDVNRLTMADSNDNWVLEYDAATKKVQFTKNIGPIETIEFDTSHVDDGDHPTGTLCWNAEDMTLNLHHANGIRQQIGQEQYFPPVKNMTGAKIPNGAVCMFAGAEEVNNARLLVAPMIADGTYPSLYLMGVATEDIEDGATGFVTAFGYVNDIDTTAWNKGDILYADPAVPGGLTNVKPTAPNNVVPVAAVVRKNATIGRIMVRPTVEQKMLYATFSSTTDQNPSQTNTPYAVVFNATDIARGFHVDGQVPADYSKIYAEESGYFRFTASLSLTSTNSSAKAFYVWLRKNGVDVPRSAQRQSVSGNGTYQVLNYTKSISLDNGDYIQIMYAVSDTTISIDAPAATEFCPAIPAATLSCIQVAL